MNFDSLFASPGGRTSRSHFVPALVTLLAVFAFYTFVVKGRTAQWCMVVLLWPAFVLHARRLHDMGRSALLLLVPVILLLCTFAIRLEIITVGETLRQAVPLLALGLSAAIALWGCLGTTRGVATPVRSTMAS